jgi:hypothetical protein
MAIRTPPCFEAWNGARVRFATQRQEWAPWPKTAAGTLARFRQINLNAPRTHHDALEFTDGTIVTLARLFSGQRATVLQLPVKIDSKAPSSAGTEQMELSEVSRIPDKRRPLANLAGGSTVANFGFSYSICGLLPPVPLFAKDF